MTTLTNIAVGLVAMLHVYFLVLEIFLWDKPFGRRTFGLTPEFAAASKSLAANQGLYNGFLAAGLVWGLVLGASGYSIKIFFLACVIAAGIWCVHRESKNSLGTGVSRCCRALVGLSCVRQMGAAGSNWLRSGTT